MTSTTSFHIMQAAIQPTEAIKPLPSTLVRRLQAIVGKRYVLSAVEELATYECDGCVLVKAPPQVVVLPNTANEVAQVVKACHEFNIPFVARGAGTGLSGGALTSLGGVLIGMNRMNKIVSIDANNRRAVVQPGLVNAKLNQSLAPYGLFYAPDPSSQSACTIGGNLAENAGGIHCIRYGVTTDHMLSLEVVLPDGTLTRFNNPNRRSQGLNWVGLFVGSEGTLGICTEATVKLTPLPECTQVYLAAFTHEGQATNAVADIITNGLQPAALEFMDQFTVQGVNQAFQVGFPDTAEAVLLIELDGSTQQVEATDVQLQALLKRHQPEQIKVGTTPEERQALWKARKLAVAAYGRYFPAFYLHDCVIPRDQLTAILAKIKAIATEYDLTIGNVFHAGDGNLHPNILFDPKDSAMVERVLKGGEAILDACLAVGGTLSGEHGIGLEKSEFMPRLFTKNDLEKMLHIKQAFDPKGLANPLKIFPQRHGCGETNKAMTATQLVNDGTWV